MVIKIYSNPGVDSKIRGHDQNRKKDSGEGKREEKEDRQGIEKSQKGPVHIDGERDKIISQPSVGKDIEDVVSDSVGKAEDVDGKDKPDGIQPLNPEIEQRLVKHGTCPAEKKCEFRNAEL